MINIFVDKTDKYSTARDRGFFVCNELLKRKIKVNLYSPLNELSCNRFDSNYFFDVYKTFKAIYRFNDNEVIYLVRTVYSLYFTFLIIFFSVVLNRKYIFDFDDAIYLKPRVRVRLQTFLLVKYAAHVVVGSAKLFQWAKLKNNNVTMIPSVVPYNNYNSHIKKKSNNNANLFTIGWIGHAVNHINNLQLLAPIFRSLISKGLKFKFILIGGMKPSDKRLDFLKQIDGYELQIIENIDWTNPDSPPSAIAQFDVGVMPLVKNPKTEAKCSFKIIEYMATSVVAIASPVGENNAVIKHGYDGYLPKSSDEWVSIIESINNNPLLKETVARRGSRKVKEFYSYNYAIPKILNIVKSIIDEN